MGTATAAAAPPVHLINAKSAPEAVAALARDLVPSWSSLPTSSLEVKVISGGITNALWAVTVAENQSIGEISPKAVAVRAYGDKTDLLIDRALEVETLRLLNAKGFGAVVIASFGSGRVEEFLPGRALTPDEIAERGTAERIAEGLARLHAVDWGRRDKGRERKNRLFFSFLSSCFSSRRPPTKPASTYSAGDDSALFSTIWEWIALADRLDAEEAEKKEKKNEGEKYLTSPSVDSAELRAEVALLEEKVEASCCPFPSSSSSSSSSSSGFFCPELSRVVFCHMDLLPGNIMVTDSEEGREREEAAKKNSPGEEEKKAPPRSGPGPGLQFIDFEYGRPCQAAFDVGNHWCEYAGLDCDWSRYPTGEQQRWFARAYLSEAAAIASSSPSSSSGSSSPVRPPSEERVSAFVEQAKLFSLVAHLFWTSWAKVQVHVSPIDFDYSEYARSRFDDYKKRKQSIAAFSSS